ncbi:hypothetical protein Sgly_1201 [Syntrophobotulus glycolicus DSM 8271]|uniref:Uncharacterized protein n=1 Tax=Syntrophobotulus glycolicus (strain DSM 8271 / FlGlyR) TaxID=645991 RepID=F0SUM6_SYNGF|nr:hypothetical protein [Syntrophobotulus glycolicus]ADY55519.1 hypothetical protein Sgly_1201 [Syntrophobotulus glycolicus DSM 8271]
MNINTDTYFMGAYNQRMAKQNSMRSAPMTKMQEVTAELEKIGFQEIPAVVSLSDKAKMLFADSAVDKLQNDREELYQKAMATRLKNEGTDEFAVNGNDQWLVFSNFLHNVGFYDEMSNEHLKKTEQILMKITDGMDDVFSWEHHVGFDLSDQFHGEQLDSHEARVELESSTAALRYFSENLLDGEIKTGFDELIKKCDIHNSAILNDGYSSIEEKFRSGRSQLSADTKGKLEAERLRQPESLRSEQAAKDLEIGDILGSMTSITEEINAYTAEIADLFSSLNQENQVDIFNQVKKRFFAFVIKDSDNEALKEFVMRHSDHVFNNINNYWSDLMKRVEEEKQN